MTIKEVYKRIEELKHHRENFIKIQEFCLGHMATSKELDEMKHTKIYGALEDNAGLSIGLRELASESAKNIDREVERLNKIIENTQIKID